MKIKAGAITDGVAVKRSDRFWTVLAVKKAHSVVTCITQIGGRISFFASDIVRVVR